MTLSLLIPLYNAEKKVPQLINALDEFIISSGQELTVEVIFVNDGSTDNTEQILRPYISGKFRLINLSYNTGQQNALYTGLHFCSGEWTITLDDDLEHPLAAIKDILRKAAAAGADLVYAVPEQKNTTFLRRAGSCIFNVFFSSVLHKPFHIRLSSYRGIHQSLKYKILSLHCSYPYVSALAFLNNPVAVNCRYNPGPQSPSRFSLRSLVSITCNVVLQYGFLKKTILFKNPSTLPDETAAAIKENCLNET